MNRRRFVTTSAGVVAGLVSPGCWAFESRASRKRAFDFAEYKGADAAVPIHRVTPDDAPYVHTYYDVSPWSPSGRFLAATKLPYQDRYPVLGDSAEVCVIDLKDRTVQTVHRTKSWGFQTGANLNWGGTDRYLYTNDIVDGTSVCARIDLDRGETRLFSGPAYNVAPDDSCVIGFPLELMDATQLGYGVPSKDPLHPRVLPEGASKTQGLWRTDLKTNKKTLLVSLEQLAVRVPEPAPWKGGTWYLWHSKHNNPGTRILQISRTLFPNGEGLSNTLVFTFNTDGSDIRLLPANPVWGTNGGHPNWHADGEHVIRNLPVGGRMRFCQWRYDGSDCKLLTEKLEGGGHPRIDPTGRYIVTDTFDRREGRQRVVIRFIDLRSDSEQAICRMPTIDRAPLNVDELSMVRRLDGHPNWDRNFKKLIFQAAPEGNRQLYIADVGRWVS